MGGELWCGCLHPKDVSGEGALWGRVVVWGLE